MKNIIFLFILASFTGCKINKPKAALNGYNSDVSTIIANKCYSCHTGGNAEGNLGAIDNANTLIAQGYITPGNPAESVLYQKITTPEFGARMPYGGPYLNASEITAIANWIRGLSQSSSSCVPRIMGGTPSFVNDVKPLLDQPLPQNAGTAGTSCLGCHGAGSTRWKATTGAGLTYANVTGANVGLSPYAGALVVPGDPCNSRLYMRLSQAGVPSNATAAEASLWNQMPKGAANPVKMTEAQLAIIYTWILDGAPNN